MACSCHRNKQSHAVDNKCLTQELHGVIGLDLVNLDLFELRKVNIDSQEVHPENGHAHSAKRTQQEVDYYLSGSCLQRLKVSSKTKTKIVTYSKGR